MYRLGIAHFWAKVREAKWGMRFRPPSGSNLTPKEQSGSSILRCQTTCVLEQWWTNRSPFWIIGVSMRWTPHSIPSWIPTERIMVCRKNKKLNNILLLGLFFEYQWTRSKLAELCFTQKRVKDGVSKMDIPMPKVALHDLSCPSGV